MEKEMPRKLGLLSLREEREMLTVLIIYNYVVGSIWRRLRQAIFFEGMVWWEVEKLKHSKF